MGPRRMTRPLVIAALVVGCSSNSGQSADSTVPDPVGEGDTQMLVQTESTDTSARHPLAGIDLTVPRLHLYVPQPE